MGHYECKKCGQYYDDCTCGKTPAVATNATGATFERRGSAEVVPLPHHHPKGGKSTSSARGSVTVRRPDGTTITCTIDQLQDVLEQVHKVRPRTVEVTCTAPANEHAVTAAVRGKLDQTARMISKCDQEMVPHVPEIPIGFGPGIKLV